MSNTNKLIPSLFIILSLISSPTLAIKVTNVKNNKILVDLENDSVKPDDILEFRKNNIVMATAKVLQVRPHQAVANIESGNFTIDQKLIKASTPKNTTQPSIKPQTKLLEEEGIVLRHDMIKVSVIGKFISNSISAKLSDNSSPFINRETVDMVGSDIGFGLAVDYPKLKWVDVRGTLSLDPVQVKGKAKYSSCNNKSSTNCYAKINYFSAAGFFRYDFIKKQYVVWGGLGGALKFPMSKESTSLRTTDINMANALVLTGGVDYSLNNKYFIPASFEYHYSLNTSDTVPKISQIVVQGGLGMKF